MSFFVLSRGRQFDWIRIRDYGTAMLVTARGKERKAGEGVGGGDEGTCPV